VWNVNVAVAQLENDLGDAEGTVIALENKVEEAEANSRAIISIEKDIEYMKAALQRIEQLVTTQ
jgi:multidrug resistance efflux pump